MNDRKRKIEKNYKEEGKDERTVSLIAWVSCLIDMN